MSSPATTTINRPEKRTGLKNVLFHAEQSQTAVLKNPQHQVRLCQLILCVSTQLPVEQVWRGARAVSPWPSLIWDVDPWYKERHYISLHNNTAPLWSKWRKMSQLNLHPWRVMAVPVALIPTPAHPEKLFDINCRSHIIYRHTLSGIYG